MAAGGGRDVEMQHYSSSPTSLSSPPSGISEPASPTRFINRGRANMEMDEIVVDPGSGPRFGVMQQASQFQQQSGQRQGSQQSSQPQPEVRLTAAGLPRKKPGRKPGTTVKPKVAADGTEAPKQRRPRKPRDPNAPPVQRKRKLAQVDDAQAPTAARPIESAPFAASSAGSASVGQFSLRQQPESELTSMRSSLDAHRSVSSHVHSESAFAPKEIKRESFPGSMRSLLNDDPPPTPPQQQQQSLHQAPAVAAAPARQRFDPVRGNYDPVRETMVTRDPYGTGTLGSPRAPTQMTNRASASPSIASLVDPPAVAAANSAVLSPNHSHASFANTPGNSGSAAATQARFHEPNSMPPSPSQPLRSAPVTKPTIVEIKRPAPAPPAPAETKPAEPAKGTFFTTTSLASLRDPPAPPAAASAAQQSSNKKLAAVVEHDRKKEKGSSASSSHKDSKEKDSHSKAEKNADKDKDKDKDKDTGSLPGGAILPGSERSILDFGKVDPNDELEAPSIVLHVPLNGETNKYVNFARMAEERYGWDALHPRLAANRERKARIAAATAALERSANNGSSRDSGDEMSVDLQSGDEGEKSDAEMGGMGNGNGTDKDATAAKPAKKKRVFKEDEYDKDDDFVDDSEMLWEEQAAASRDGFFVYSGPLVQEVEKPAAGTEAPTRRGRGGGRGSRGGRGARAAAAAAAAAAAEKGEGTNGTESGTGTPAATTKRGRGGGPGSRGGSVTRKPRITKLEKEQRDREKAEREKMVAQMASKTGGTGASARSSSPSGGYSLLSPGGPASNAQPLGLVG